MPTGHDGEFSLIILPPFWKRTWFIVTVGMAAAGFSVAAIRYSAWRKAQRVIAELGRMTAVQAERARIARDLHDGLGADLTQVALLSELAQVNFDQPDRARAYVDDTFRAAQKLTRAVDEVVWTLDPSNDTLARFGPYVADFVQEYLETADLDCRLTLPDRWPDQQIAPSLRHHLFLSIKEALRNIVAHAKASAVCMEIRLEDNLLALTISDDGCGFDPLGGERSRPGGGHGLANMRKRMADVGGTLDIDSAAGKGTTLRLQAKL